MLMNVKLQWLKGGALLFNFLFRHRFALPGGLCVEQQNYLVHAPGHLINNAYKQNMKNIQNIQYIPYIPYMLYLP